MFLCQIQICCLGCGEGQILILYNSQESGLSCLFVSRFLTRIFQFWTAEAFVSLESDCKFYIHLSRSIKSPPHPPPTPKKKRERKNNSHKCFLKLGLHDSEDRKLWLSTNGNEHIYQGLIRIADCNRTANGCDYTVQWPRFSNCKATEKISDFTPRAVCRDGLVEFVRVVVVGDHPPPTRPGGTVWPGRGVRAYLFRYKCSPRSFVRRELQGARGLWRMLRECQAINLRWRFLLVKLFVMMVIACAVNLLRPLRKWDRWHCCVLDEVRMWWHHTWACNSWMGYHLSW